MTIELTQIKEWQALIEHFKRIKMIHMREWFENDNSRFKRYSIKAAGILFDYSRNRISDETLKLLFELASARQLSDKIKNLFSGGMINATEKRPALHTALRDAKHVPISLHGNDIVEDIKFTQHRLANFVEKITEGRWLGVTGKPIKNIVNIGIGGSYIGPMMCSYALKDFSRSNFNLYFVSTVDKIPLKEIMMMIDPETTIFIVSSKSFNTIETLTNANTFLKWMRANLKGDVLSNHFIAVTAKPEKALKYGIPTSNIFPLWDWVGGRYSVWSAIALPIMLMIGTEQFDSFLQGAYEMDQHFMEAPYENNMPVVMALLNIWYINFFNITACAIIPYAHHLRYFIPYLQQVEMESNGKRNRLDGEICSYATSPIIFGEEGCRGQHAYHQLLHQGQHIIPADFILTNNAELNEHDDILMASALSQAQALMRGKTEKEAYDELIKARCPNNEAKQLSKHQTIPGNKPSNILFLNQLTPHSLGALIALYEHRIFVQGVIWDINSFDQWGVELGKQLLPDILHGLHDQQNNSLPAEIQGLLKHVRQ